MAEKEERKVNNIKKWPEHSFTSFKELIHSSFPTGQQQIKIISNLGQDWEEPNSPNRECEVSWVTFAGPCQEAAIDSSC